MEKRLFLAIALSMLILVIYSGIASHFAPKNQQNQQLIDNVTLGTTISYEKKPDQSLNQEKKKPPELEDVSPKEEQAILENADLFLLLDPRGSAISEANIKYYNSSLPQANIGKLIEWQDIKFDVINITNGKILSYDDKERELKIKKTYRFSEDKHILEMDLEFINTSKIKSYVKYSLNLASINAEIFKKTILDPTEQRYLECAISFQDKMLRKQYFAFNPSSVVSQVNWVGIRDRYFCSILRPMQAIGQIIKNVNGNTTSYILESPSLELPPGQAITHNYKIYLGPQKQEFIAKLGGDSENMVNFGFFDTISQMLLGALNLLYKLSKNWGFTIILFSILVFILMYPLSMKSFSSMKKMQELQPVIEELKAQYKDNSQKLHKEIMELYRKEKINPFGGCLPMLLQMPIFVSLFQLLVRFVDLKGTRFLWIKDLSAPDRLFVFKNMPKSIPIIGNELNLLPLIMIVTMLFQQKLTSVKKVGADDTAKQQKMMSLFMSIFFGVIFYHMPSGLVLYWTVNSILMLIFQIRIFKQTSRI